MRNKAATVVCKRGVSDEAPLGMVDVIGCIARLLVTRRDAKRVFELRGNRNGHKSELVALCQGSSDCQANGNDKADFLHCA